MLNVFDSLMSKVLLGLAILLIAGTQYLYWFGEGGHLDHLKLRQDIENRLLENNDLRERNRILAAQVYDLKNGVEAIEEYARLDLGLIKSNETFIQMSTVGTQYQPIYLHANPTDSMTNDTVEQANHP